MVKKSYKFKKEFSSEVKSSEKKLIVDESFSDDLFKSLTKKTDGALNEISLLKNQLNSINKSDRALLDPKLKEINNLVGEIKDLKEQILVISSKSVFSDSDSFLKLSSRLDSVEKKFKDLNNQFLAINLNQEFYPLMPTSNSDSLISVMRSEINNLSSVFNNEIGKIEENSRVLQEHSRKISEVSKRMNDIDSIVVVVYRHLLSVQDSVFTEMRRLRAGGS